MSQNPHIKLILLKSCPRNAPPASQEHLIPIRKKHNMYVFMYVRISVYVFIHTYLHVFYYLYIPEF